MYEWNLQLKTSFNLGPTKQVQQIIFSHKTSKRTHPGLIFNCNMVNLTTTRKHFEMMLDSTLPFDEHLEPVLSKISKTIGLFRQFQRILPRTNLLTICQSLARLHLDNGDI